MEEQAKLDFCPRCEEPGLADCWTSGRRLRQECMSDCCNWVGNSRTPETIPIQHEKKYWSFRPGHCYEVYDKYGHCMVSSRSFNLEEDCFNAMMKEIEHYDENCSPKTGVIWPTYVTARASVWTHVGLKKEDK